MSSGPPTLQREKSRQLEDPMFMLFHDRYVQGQMYDDVRCARWPWIAVCEPIPGKHGTFSRTSFPADCVVSTANWHAVQSQVGMANHTCAAQVLERDLSGIFGAT